MKQTIINLIISFVFITQVQAQEILPGKFSVQVHYGPQGNFFVRSYDEQGGPSDKIYLYKKNFVGTISGIEMKYKTGQRSLLSIGYARGINLGKKNVSETINGVSVLVQDFQLRNVDNIFQLNYERLFSKKNNMFTYQVGLFILNSSQQEISIENYNNSIDISERNFENSKLQEGGTSIAISYSKKIDTKFKLGIQAKVYYLISTNSFEMISLTPTLSYTFVTKRDKSGLADN